MGGGTSTGTGGGETAVITGIPVFPEQYRTQRVLLQSAAFEGYQRFLVALDGSPLSALSNQITICYMDANAKPLLLLSGDDASLLTTVLAPNKAYTALMLNRDTKQVGARMRELHVAPPSYGDARITDFAGGVLIRNQSVGVVGAVGVSGATPMQDHALAVLARNQIFPPYPEFDYEEADAADD